MTRWASAKAARVDLLRSTRGKQKKAAVVLKALENNCVETKTQQKSTRTRGASHRNGT
jgi:hypothetical protein